tara:strand:- start:1567 stop:1803 length:237 start_codon:yes stop_codon:yes gene_type:complete
MKEKIVTLKPIGISQKQWASFLLELNLMKKAWKPYGVDVQMSAPGLRNVLKWGTDAYVTDRKIRRTSKSLSQDKESEV